MLFMSDFRTGDPAIPDSTGPPIQVFDISNTPPVKVDEITHVTHDSVVNDHGIRSHDLYAMTETGTEGVVFDASSDAISVFQYEWENGNFKVEEEDKFLHLFSQRRGQKPDNFEEQGPKMAHSTWVGSNTNYLYSTTENSSGHTSVSTWIDPGSPAYQLASYLSVWDISDIEKEAEERGFRYPIEQVYEVRHDASDGNFHDTHFGKLDGNEKVNSIHNIHTRSDTAYISYYTNGIRVLDVNQPKNMTELAYYVVDGLDEYTQRPVYNGAWGVDPFLPGGTVLGSSADGLYVFYPPGEFGGDIEVATRWTTDITVVDPLSVNEEVTIQDNNITVALKADMDLQSDIALADAGLTLEANGGTRTIEAVDGTYTIGAEGQASSSAKIAGGGSAGEAEIVEETSSERPEEPELKSNYPNPFNPVTTIEYVLPEEAEVRLEIYDILGRRVAVLEDGMQEAGTHQVQWDASGVSSGTYIYRLEAGEHVESRHMTLIK